MAVFGKTRHLKSASNLGDTVAWNAHIKLLFQIELSFQKVVLVPSPLTKYPTTIFYDRDTKDFQL